MFEQQQNDKVQQLQVEVILKFKPFFDTETRRGGGWNWALSQQIQSRVRLEPCFPHSNSQFLQGNRKLFLRNHQNTVWFLFPSLDSGSY